MDCLILAMRPDLVIINKEKQQSGSGASLSPFQQPLNESKRKRKSGKIVGLCQRIENCRMKVITLVTGFLGMVPKSPAKGNHLNSTRIKKKSPGQLWKLAVT